MTISRGSSNATPRTPQTPDQGEIRGQHEVAEYLRQFNQAFPDLRYELSHGYEAGNVAIDEGHLRGTNTRPMVDPSSGQEIPATGNHIDMRACDVAVVEDGLITEHRFYFDEMELYGQLGIRPQEPT